MPKLQSLFERKNKGNTKSRLGDFKNLNCVSIQNEQKIDNMSHENHALIISTSII